MVVDELGKPFSGKIWYWVEDSFGSGESSTTLPISRKVLDVRIDTGDLLAPKRGIDKPQADEAIKQVREPKLHIEYIPQYGDTLLEDVVNRDSCGELQSLAFYLGANVCESDSDDKTHYYIVGAKPNTVKISGSKNTEYTVAIDFMAKSVVTVSSQVGSEPTPLSGSLCVFNVAGEITKSGGHVVNTNHIAFITNSIEITITHKLTPYTDHDSLEPDYIIEGELDVEGTVDITLDGGGGLHFAEVLNTTEFDIVVNLGNSGSPKLTLTDCQWKSSSIDVNISGEAMMESAPFFAKPSDIESIVGTV